MIKYSLICKECNLSFESWFASSSEFEKLKRKKLLNCHKCNSLKVDKNLMAPSINKKLNIQKDKELKKLNKIKKTIKEYQNFIKNNFDYVGENFAYEARSIHYNEDKKKHKGIYGTASEQDLRDLSEEGIEIRKIPWIKDNDN
tara:strand:- start:522 stop:950 length:429 start_codon:yes stop_codon:yes gene_type:complete